MIKLLIYAKKDGFLENFRIKFAVVFFVPQK